MSMCRQTSNYTCSVRSTRYQGVPELWLGLRIDSTKFDYHLNEESGTSRCSECVHSVPVLVPVLQSMTLAANAGVCIQACSNVVSGRLYAAGAM